MSVETDRELLELAAKAACIRVLKAPANAAHHDSLYCWINNTRKPWAPLRDDGDALRLAVKLQMNIWIGDGGSEADVDTPKLMPSVLEKSNDTYAATRRAIVRAAAEIGRTL